MLTAEGLRKPPKSLDHKVFKAFLDLIPAHSSLHEEDYSHPTPTPEHPTEYLPYVYQITGFTPEMISPTKLEKTKWPAIPIKAFMHAVLASYGLADSILIPGEDIVTIYDTVLAYLHGKNPAQGVWLSLASPYTRFTQSLPKITAAMEEKEISARLMEVFNITLNKPGHFVKVVPQGDYTIMPTRVDNGDVNLLAHTGPDLSFEIREKAISPRDASHDGQDIFHMLHITRYPTILAFTNSLPSAQRIIHIVSDNKNLLKEVIPLYGLHPMVIEFMVNKNGKVTNAVDIDPILPFEAKNKNITTADQLQPYFIEHLHKFGPANSDAITSILQEWPNISVFPNSEKSTLVENMAEATKLLEISQGIPASQFVPIVRKNIGSVREALAKLDDENTSTNEKHAPSKKPSDQEVYAANATSSLVHGLKRWEDQEITFKDL